MKIELVPCSAFCELRTFTIDGQDADWEDFVDKYDHDADNAPAYGCGDMRCDRKEHTQEVLAKYGITVVEYEEIVEMLCNALDFGCCEWCV